MNRRTTITLSDHKRSSRVAGKAAHLPQQQHHNKQHLGGRSLVRHVVPCLVVTTAFWLVFVLANVKMFVSTTSSSAAAASPTEHRMVIQEESSSSQHNPRTSFRNNNKSRSRNKLPLPEAFQTVLERAKEKQDFCQNKDDNFQAFDQRFEVPFRNGNDTVATLPAFGIIEALQQWQQQQQPSSAAAADVRDADNNNKWQCQLPPETECDETQLTVIFLAYNPNRLGKTLRQIKKMLDKDEFSNLVKEVVLVWNGPRHVDESHDGRQLLEYAATHPVRVVYPLKMGFPNDLMNRYHPDVVQVTSKAILYYDDDGPFYSFKATQGGFELWKRHASAQIGAMARQIDYSPRQQQERQSLSTTTTTSSSSTTIEPNDRLFVSHCDNLNDQVEYNFHYFANYDANMVLPSGSFLHANYLCFLWHPVLEPIRKFVLRHPVHPDDVTVSTVVSHLSGRAPRVYSRRLNKPDDTTTVTAQEQQRRLEDVYKDDKENEYDDDDDVNSLGIVAQASSEQQHRRRLASAGMGGICWDCGAGMTDQKKIWAALRAQAINTLVRYFGSINSGSIGWCEGTQYYDPTKPGKCNPLMAKQGWLPWMKPDGTPKDTCP